MKKNTSAATRLGLSAALLLCCALGGCTAAKPQAPPQPTEPRQEQLKPSAEAVPDVAAVQQEMKRKMAALPAGKMAEENGQPVLSYPDEALFGKRAVLPFPGGPEVLDPLSDFLKAFPDMRWTARVRAQTGISPEYDQALARRRAQILGFYFQSKGIAPESLDMIPLVETGAPLEIRPAGSSKAP